MERLWHTIDALAADTAFSGVVRVDAAGASTAKAYGFSRRDCAVPNTVDTQFAIASGVKGMTALTIISLVEEGKLALATTARSVLGQDLPLIDDRVTIEHLLAHRSGIGDYLDEDAGDDVTDYILRVPAHQLATTEQYVAVLDGYPMKFAPNERFAYCNGGYVVLALIAERVTGKAFADLVGQRVCAPAGMSETAFLRSDELPGRAAIGYLDADGLRTNIFHLPVRGSGDGGIYTTAHDIDALWHAFSSSRIVSERWTAEMLRPRSDVPDQQMRYGLGFWLRHDPNVAELHGYDAGVSFQTVHDAARHLTYTVLSNTTRGAWPIVRHLDAALWG
jgi:CubicO group peptidase (beta-lactamase class C family)